LRKRSLARRIALQALYQLDLCKSPLDSDIIEFIREQGGDDEGVTQFAESLVKGVMEHLGEIDAQISSVAKHWRINRIAYIDRNVLRISAYELLWRDDIPMKVSINEAIELAKQFSTAESGLFVNGILDKIKENAQCRARG